MLLTNSLGDPLLEAAHIALLSHRRVDGLVISGARRDAIPRRPRAGSRELDIPVVVLDRNLPPEIPVSRVLSDHRSGMKAAGLHLLDLGHRRIAPDRRRRRAARARASRRARGRLRGVRAAADLHRRRGCVLGRARRCRDAAAARPARAADGGDRRREPVDAGGASRRVGAGGHARAGTCRSSAATTSPITDLFQPPVAVVRRDNFAMGRTAAELLLARLRDDAPPSDVVLPTEFVARPSCAPP